MEVTIQLPDEIARQLGDPATMPRSILEAFAAEAYRSQLLSRQQIGVLLGLDYWGTEEFLTRFDAKRTYTLEDLDSDRGALSALPKK